ncbi:Leucine-rich repeat-containing protein 4C [Branchiostoma belcheri]|nr:Leucine-rich repeat-containing protein 4C [Branchiostoma belcheri]
MFPLPCCLLGNAQRKLPKIAEAVVGSSRETKSNIGKWRVPIFGYRRLSSPCRNRSTLTPNSLIWDHYSLLENAGRDLLRLEVVRLQKKVDLNDGRDDQFTTMLKPLEAWFPMMLLLYPTAGQWDCPKVCECSEFAQSVYCGDKFLSTIPIGIPRDHLTSLEELVFINNSVTILSAKNFAGLTKLKRLNMSKNRLLEIEQGTFDDLTALQELDLSYNNLSGLPYGLFSNMAALQSLRLQYNPWNCSCQIKWLNQFLRTHVGNGGTNSCGYCKSPRRYEGIILCDTSLENMQCSAPRLEVALPNATLNVSVGESAALQCNVNPKNEKDSTVSWTKPDGSPVRPGTFRFRVKLSKAGTRLNISRVTMSDAGIYRCVARNSEGSATFDTILNVTGSILPINKATEIPMLEEPMEDDFDSSVCTVPQDNLNNNGSQLQRDIGSDIVKWPPTTDSLDITNTPTYSEGTGREGVDRKTYVVGLVGAVAGLVVVLWIVFCLATKCSRMKRRRRCRKKAQQDIKGCMRRSSCLDNNSKPEDIVEIPDIHTITGKGLYDHENITTPCPCNTVYTSKSAAYIVMHTSHIVGLWNAGAGDHSGFLGLPFCYTHCGGPPERQRRTGDSHPRGRAPTRGGSTREELVAAAAPLRRYGRSGSSSRWSACLRDDGIPRPTSPPGPGMAVPKTDAGQHGAAVQLGPGDVTMDNLRREAELLAKA